MSSPKEEAAADQAWAALADRFSCALMRFYNNLDGMPDHTKHNITMLWFAHLLNTVVNIDRGSND